MAQRTLVTLVDDVDGGEADETVTFALDGVSYEVDLSAKNAADMREALALYVGAGRKSGTATRRTSKAKRVEGEYHVDLAKVRQWAKDNGHKVSDRGRIAGPVMEAYRAAH